MNTFWLDLSHRSSPDRSTSNHTDSTVSVREDDLTHTESLLPTATLRLVGWNVEVLKRTLQHIVATREALGIHREFVPRYVELEYTDETQEFCKAVEVMSFPRYNAEAFVSADQVSSTVLGDQVESELHEYVLAIANRYRDNHFHSFSHCSHVMVSETIA